MRRHEQEKIECSKCVLSSFSFTLPVAISRSSTTCSSPLCAIAVISYLIHLIHVYAVLHLTFPCPSAILQGLSFHESINCFSFSSPRRCNLHSKGTTALINSSVCYKIEKHKMKSMNMSASERERALEVYMQCWQHDIALYEFISSETMELAKLSVLVSMEKKILRNVSRMFRPTILRRTGEMGRSSSKL